MSYEHILYEVADPVATVVLNRPDALNAWTATMGEEVADAMGRAEQDPAVVGIVLTGAGRGFCAGADMTLLTTAAGEASGSDPSDSGDAASRIISTSDRADPADDLHGRYTYFMSLSKPVVAAINGPVAGMGVPVALACDIRIMSADALITTSFAQRGLIAEWGISWLLSRLVGPAHALDLLFTSRRVGGEEAERIGLVNRAVEAGQARAAAEQYVADIAATSSPQSMAVMKRQVYEDLQDRLGVATARAEDLMLESFARNDFREGVQSYVDRRRPAFGRLGE
ncbi:enoyl-CoA hydratase [soil metagenome]